MKKYLLILEVSQKQAYIFKSKKLKNNIAASDIIRYVTDTDFFNSLNAGFNEDKNLVYSGGGHAVLVFESRDEAVSFAESVSRKIMEKFRDLEMFMKITETDPDKSNSENIKELIRQLEVKKSVRRSTFSQGRFGFETMEFSEITKKKDGDTEKLLPENYTHKKEIDDREFSVTAPFDKANEFEKLGGSKGESNFIAVVHIDGNRMGARVADFDSKADSLGFEEYAAKKKAFSESIDRDFTDAYFEMLAVVKEKIENGTLKSLDFSKNCFPVRRVVMAGDDICFVTEGRIGLECAAEYINILSKKTNSADGKSYSACAGVAVVHQKYPFYKAYKLAESLCDNAKKYIANRDGEADKHTSAIDWHIEYGEIFGSVLGARETDNRNYMGIGSDSRIDIIADREKLLSSRPYVICSDDEPTKAESYAGFKSMVRDVNRYESKAEKEEGALAARGKLKTLRNIMKKGEKYAHQYLKDARINDGIAVNNRTFDALEIMDTFIDFKPEGDKK